MAKAVGIRSLSHRLNLNFEQATTSLDSYSLYMLNLECNLDVKRVHVPSEGGLVLICK